MSSFINKYALLIAILALAIILRLPNLNDSFWMDEAAQALQALRPAHEQFDLINDFQPPLLHLITFVSAKFNHAEWWLRLWGALIPAILTIWGTYLIGAKIISQKVGLLAAFLLSTSSFHVFFSQELRPYSLSAVFAIWSWFFLLEVLKVGSDSYQIKRNSQINAFFNLFPISRDFFIFLFLSILGLYSSYLYPFVLLSQLILLIIYRKNKLFLYSLLIPSISFLPWLPTFLQQLNAGQALRSSFPGWENIVSFSQIKAPALSFGKFLYGIIDLEVNLIFASLTTIFFAFILYFLWHSRQRFLQEKSKFNTFFYLIFLPFILASIVSIFVPVIQPKRVIFLLPFFYLMISYLIFGSRHNWQKLNFIHWLSIIYLIGLNLYGLQQYYTQTIYQRENWRSALLQLHHKYPTSDTIAVFAYTAPFSSWRWYEKDQPQPYPTLSTGNYDTNQLENLPQILNSALNYQHIIIFDYLRSLTDSQNRLPLFFEANGYFETFQLQYDNLGIIRIYTRILPTIAQEKGNYI